MKMHSQTQRLVFLTFINQYLDITELDKEIKKLRRGVPYTFQKNVERIVHKEDITTREAQLMALVYLLHQPSIRKGYIDETIKILIKESGIEFEKEEIERVHKKLKAVLNNLGIPILQIDKNLVENIGKYSESFRKNNRDLY